MAETSRASEAAALVWLRDDLRLADNPALFAACQSGRRVFVAFVLDEESPGLRALGGASKWWLAQSLSSLSQDFERIGGALHIHAGPAATLIPQLAHAIGASSVFWNRRYLRAEIRVDEAVQSELERQGISVETFPGTLGHEPWDILPKARGFYRVFSPYWRNASTERKAGSPLPAPTVLRDAGSSKAGPTERSVEELGLWPKPDWAGGLREAWGPGEKQAQQTLQKFVDRGLGRYGEDRDSPFLAGSSRLSPHLRFGELSPRQVKAAVERAPASLVPPEAKTKFLQELAWRDFSYNLLYHAPDLPFRAFDPRFESFPYATLSAPVLRAWQHGHTGYPFVDAGMRQLWRTGTMHNRARMVVASFLVKHLLADWRLGESWFWDTLCDADPANNAVNWQWVAGSGPDAAPFFRIFNPVLQSRKFDPEGQYIRRFVPELGALDGRFIHAPWEAPPEVLKQAGVSLGTTYPRPIVEHGRARKRALDAYASATLRRPDR